MADEKVQVNENDFLKNLNKHKKAAEVAKKAERSSGILDAKALAKRLGLEPGDEITLGGTVTKITFGFAKQDKSRPYFMFNYSLSDNSPNTGKGKGLIVNNYYEVSEGKDKDGEVYRTIDQALERLFFEFQALGEDTASWTDPMKQALTCAKEHTKNKTPIQLSISMWENDEDPDSKKYKTGLNYRVVNVENNDDLEDSDDEEYEDDDSEDSEDSEEESDDDSDSESDEDDEFNPEDWIGEKVKWEDDDGAVEFTVKAYDADTNTFSGVDDDGDEWSDAPADQCEWLGSDD